MSNITFEAGTLTANREERVVSGLLLPYGEIGRTNLGKFSVDRGVFQIPSDPLVLTANLDHKREDPVGRALTLNDTDAGLFASYKIAETPEGDQLLEDIEDGKRKSLSVEAADVVIRDGKATAGRVFGTAFVETGAFPSATLLAEDVGEEPTNQNPDATAAPTNTEPEATVPEPLTATAAPGGVAARAQTKSAVEPETLFASIANGYRTGDFGPVKEILDQGNPELLFAALNDVKFSGVNTVGSALTNPTWLGKFWDGEPHQRVVAPLLTQAPLTSLVVQGWDWTTAPKVARWAGNKTNVPSNTPAATRRDFAAQRIAGAHDIAREFVDFPNPEFWQKYFEAMRESYAVESDAYALERLVATATPVSHLWDDPDVPEVLVKLIDGALAVNKKGVPTFAVLSERDFRQFALAPKDHVLELLSASLKNLSEGNLAGFTVVPTPYDQDGVPVLDDGQVLVGTKAAATFRELPGSPIRVEGLDMVKGGVDPGLFGYALVQVDAPAGLALVNDESVES